MSDFISNAKTLRLTNEIINSAAYSIEDKNSKAFLNARNKLIEDFRSLILEQRGIKEEDFDEGYELVTAVDHCLAKFNPEKGEFINYVFKNLWGYTLNKDNKELEISSRLVNLDSGNDDDELTQENKIDYLSYQQMAEEGGYECSYTDEIMEEYGIKNIFDAVSRVYFGLQMRTRPLFSAVFTGIIYDCLNSTQFTTCGVYNLPFFDVKAFNHAMKKGKSYSQRELAKIFGIEESNLSRSVKKFLAAIGNELKRDEWAA